MTQKETLLSVEGMTCASCIHHVDVVLKDVDGVSKVDVRLRQGQVLVQHDADTAVESLVKALTDAGYGSAPSAA
jgi:copper chaperone